MAPGSLEASVLPSRRGSRSACLIAESRRANASGATGERSVSVAVPKDGLRFTQLPAWLLYPIGYLIYSLVRGALTGTYSYPFIDVSTIGYGQAITNALLVLLAFVVVASTLLLVSRLDRIHPPSGDS